MLIKTEMAGTRSKKTWKLGTDCSGICAVSAALHVIGIDNYTYEFASDIDPNCRELLSRLPTPPKTIHQDMTKRNLNRLPRVNLYVAGFPCQAYSRMNGQGMKGLQDRERSAPMFAVIDYIRAKRPNMFVLENVPNFKSMGLPVLLEHLSDIGGYVVEWRTMSPHRYAAYPQSRSRLFIIGKRGINTIAWPEQRQLSAAGVRELLLTHDEAASIQPNVLRTLRKGNSSKWLSCVREQARGHDVDWNKHTCIVDLNNSSWGLQGAKLNYESMKLNVAPCVHGRSSMMFLINQDRFLTWLECLRIQGFPDELLDRDLLRNLPKMHVYKMIGNSMCVPLMALILDLNL